MKNFDLNTQNGRSMIEMLGVLAIIGVLSVGGIAGYSKAMSKYRINKTIEQITLIAGNIRAFWGPQKNYDGVDCTCNSAGSNCGGQSSNDGCPIVKKAKILPDEMITVEGGKITSITNPFGYGADLYTDNKSVKPDFQAFSLLYYIGDNAEACIELLSHDWTVAGVKAIRVGGDSMFKTPVSVDIAVTECANVIDATTSAYKAKGYPDMSFEFDIDINGDFWKDRSWKN